MFNTIQQKLDNSPKNNFFKRWEFQHKCKYRCNVISDLKLQYYMYVDTQFHLEMRLIDNLEQVSTVNCTSDYLHLTCWSR